MPLLTIRKLARQLRARTALLRSAVDAGLLRPARVRGRGANRYIRLFDLGEARAARDQIAAAFESGAIQPRGVRSHRRRGGPGAASGDAGSVGVDAPRRVAEVESAAGHGGIPRLDCRECTDRDLLERLNRDAAIEEFKRELLGK